jgi:flagellar protein FlbD
MITVHRLGSGKEFRLNIDQIVSVEANPDTVITLTTGDRVIVAETPELVADAVRASRVEVLSGAMRGPRVHKAG